MNNEIVLELKKIRGTLEVIKSIIESRLLGEDEPLPDEEEAIREYEERKKKGKLEFTPLNKVLRKNATKSSDREEGP